MGKTTTPQTTKQPKTIRVRTIVPWMIIGTFVASSFGVIAGWKLHIDMAYDARQSLVIIESKDLK